MTQSPIPVEITLLQKLRQLRVRFDDGQEFVMSCEYLRVFSPSAEVTGHGGPGILQTGKRNVNIVGIEPVGQYAVKLIFDDQHQSGIYSWDLLYDLGLHQSENWQQYLTRLESAGGSRD